MYLHRFAALSAALVVSLAPDSQAQNWMRNDSSIDYDIASVFRPDGRITTISLELGDFGPAMLRTIDHTGALEGMFQCTSPSGFKYLPRDAKLLPGGDLVVAGSVYESESFSHRAYVARVTPDTGVEAWQIKPVDSPGTISRVLVGSDGIYAVGSYSATGIKDDYEIYAMKTDFAGSVLWKQRFGFVGIGDVAIDAVLTSDENLVVAGVRDDYDEGHFVMFESTGSFEWNRYYDNFAPEAMCMVGDEIWMVEQRWDTEIEILSLDVSGNKLWSRSYQANTGEVQGMQSYQGGALITSRRTLDGEGRPTLLALDASADVLWYRAYDFEPTSNDHYFRHVVNVGARGLVTYSRGDETHVTSLASDGTTDASCVEVTDLTTTVASTFIGPDKPPLFDAAFMQDPATSLYTVPAIAGDEWELMCGDPCETAASSLGHGFAGSGGFVPEFQGTSGACAGNPAPRLELTQALGGSIGVLAFGQPSTGVPLPQGTLYVEPATMSTEVFVLDGPIGVPGAGTWELSIGGNLASLVGVSVALQVFVYDVEVPQLFSVSNAVVLTIG